MVITVADLTINTAGNNVNVFLPDGTLLLSGSKFADIKNAIKINLEKINKAEIESLILTDPQEGNIIEGKKTNPLLIAALVIAVLVLA